MSTSDKLYNSLQTILNENFTGEKTNIKETNYSYQFACPYCGDSNVNERKKRGHFYKESNYFHCYNCGIHKSMFNFLNDFGQLKNFSYAELDKFDEDSKIKMHEFNTIRNLINVDILFDNSLINKFAISRNDFKKGFNLIETIGTPAEKYLRKRAQTDLSHFLYDKNNNSIYILNRNKTGKIIGTQIRILYYSKQGNKYYTYNIEQIYKKLKLEIPDELIKLESLSLIFNILNIDFNKPIKVLEGAFDAFLLNNAIATAGLYKKLPFSFKNFIYINDYDKDGRNESIKLINENNKIFLWQKFLKEHKELKLNVNKKIDITDVIVAAQNKGIPLKSLSNYYSKDKYDLYFL